MEKDAETPPPLQSWIQTQHLLRRTLITDDHFSWTLPIPHHHQEDSLQFLAGVDVSYSKQHPSLACACLVVLDFLSLRLLYEDYALLPLRLPYVPGFLAFREAPVLLRLLHKLKNAATPFYPQLLMVDGNGLLHPRGFGLASHLGVLADLPTIGIGKNLHYVDGLTLSGVRELLQAEENRDKDLISLTGSSGFTWGMAMRSTSDSVKPIFISVGHRISLDTASVIVKRTCKYRVPEPIRQADIRSRQHLQEHQMRTLKEYGELEGPVAISLGGPSSQSGDAAPVVQFEATTWDMKSTMSFDVQ